MRREMVRTKLCYMALWRAFFIAQIKNGGVKRMTNKELKVMWESKRIRQWEIAKRLGVSESMFCRMMREELSEETKKQVQKIIDEWV